MIKKIFSVITVCLNSQKTIEQTLRSVLAQDQFVKEYQMDQMIDILKK